MDIDKTPDAKVPVALSPTPSPAVPATDLFYTVRANQDLHHITDWTFADVKLPEGFVLRHVEFEGRFGKEQPKNAITRLEFKGTSVIPGVSVEHLNPLWKTDVHKWTVFQGKATPPHLRWDLNRTKKMASIKPVSALFSCVSQLRYLTDTPHPGRTEAGLAIPFGQKRVTKVKRRMKPSYILGFSIEYNKTLFHEMVVKANEIPDPVERMRAMAPARLIGHFEGCLIGKFTGEDKETALPFKHPFVYHSHFRRCDCSKRDDQEVVDPEGEKISAKSHRPCADTSNHPDPDDQLMIHS